MKTALALAVCVSLFASASSSLTQPIFEGLELDQKTELARRAWIRKSIFAARYDRITALKLGGGTPETERAVLQALRWLKDHQNEDGSWGEKPYGAAMTGLALLCFLGHGEDHWSEEFGATVRKAIVWFVGQQDEKGYFSQGHRWTYQHGIATLAMAEAYGLTRVETLRPVVEKAVQLICEGQTEQGGWYYGYAKVKSDGTHWPGGDTCVSGWQIQALSAAWCSGIQLKDNMLRDARDLAAKDIKSRFDSKVGCGYWGTKPSRNEAANYCTTGIGTLCLQFLGEDGCREAKWGLDIMKAYDCDWAETKGGAVGMPLYGWYYITQAMYYSAPDPRENLYWLYWNPLCSTMLVNRQEADGHWGSPKQAGVGKGYIKGKNVPVYSTAMCCLILETYYRYGAVLQAYQQILAAR